MNAVDWLERSYGATLTLIKVDRDNGDGLVYLRAQGAEHAEATAGVYITRPMFEILECP
ncbi:hypothetical protein [Streptomyces sp. NPDC055085]